MVDTTPAAGLSPLDQVRLVEAETTRKIVATREASERSVVNARAQAVLLKKQARESGIREGLILYKGIVTKAEEEARAMVAHADSQGADLQRRGQARMEAAVQEAVSIVLGLEGGENQ